MAITFPLCSGFFEHFGGPTVTSAAMDFGSGANRQCSAVVGYTNATAVPTGITIGGTDVLSLVGSVAAGSPGGYHWGLYQGPLTVSGSQTAAATYTDSGGFIAGFAEASLLVIQGGGALTLAHQLALTEDNSGTAGSSSRTVTTTVGDIVIMQGIDANAAATGSGSGGSAVITNAAGVPFWTFQKTATTTSTNIAAAWSTGFDFYNFAFSVTEAASGSFGRPYYNRLLGSNPNL